MVDCKDPIKVLPASAAVKIDAMKAKPINVESKTDTMLQCFGTLKQKFAKCGSLTYVKHENLSAFHGLRVALRI